MDEHTNVRPPTKEDLKGKSTSLWLDTTPDTDFPGLPRDVRVDAAIVGGGIVGVTTAMLLQEAGVSTAVIEAGRIVSGVSGHTTAKITSLHDVMYKRLTASLGLEAAQIYAQANQTAISRIAGLIEKEGIDCDFRRDTACTYTLSDRNIGRIEEEVRAAEKAGLPVFFSAASPLPLPIRGAVCLNDQARFHPREYLLALAVRCAALGGLIFENTRARTIRKTGASTDVVTDTGIVRAQDVVIATHYPFYDPGFFFTRLYPYRSYVLGVRLNTSVPEGMHIGLEEPYYTMRSQPLDDGEILLLGGILHKAGHEENTIRFYKNLERFAVETFDVRSIDYHWSAQDNSTPDSVPYIGHASLLNKNLYLATGFAGWGMTHGMVAAIILSDAILGRHNDWSALYNPLRFKPGGAGHFARENFEVARHFVKGYLLSKPESLDAQSLGPGKGGVFREGGHKIAAARDAQGNLHGVSPVCTHMGCIVSWNNGEETWDCPCHGSRFSIDGGVIQAPAHKDLGKKIPG